MSSRPSRPASTAPWRRARALVALLILAVAVGALVSYWLDARHAPRSVTVAPVSVSVRQTAHGFVLSRSVGGRVLFRVRAGLETQLLQGDRAVLQHVQVVIFDPDGRHVDRMSGDEFDYDPATGIIAGRGLVHLDLEAPLPAPAAANAAANAGTAPIHVEAQGLTFNARSGAASIAHGLRFRYLQAVGHADRAELDPTRDRLTLAGHVQLQWLRPGAATVRVRAQQALLDRPAAAITLAGHPDVSVGSTRLQATRLQFLLRSDDSVRAVWATGGLTAWDPDRGLQVQAAEALAELRPPALRRSRSSEDRVLSDGRGAQPLAASGLAPALAQGSIEISRLRLRGGVRMHQDRPGPDGGRSAALTAAGLTIDFLPRNLPALAVADGGDDGRAQFVVQTAAASGQTIPTLALPLAPSPASSTHAIVPHGGRTTTLVAAPSLRFRFATAAVDPPPPQSAALPPSRRFQPEPRSALRSVTTLGRGEIDLRPPAQAPVQVVADDFALQWAPSGHPSRLTARGSVQLAQAGATGSAASARSSRADMLTVLFNPVTGAAQQAIESGRVELRQRDRVARADLIHYNFATAASELQANPASAFTHGRVTASDPEIRFSAYRVRERANGIDAAGTVAASLLPVVGVSPRYPTAATGNVALLDSQEPVQISAQSMHLDLPAADVSNPGVLRPDIIAGEAPAGSARFLGAVRLWQGSTVLMAPRVDLDRARQTLLATGGVTTNLVGSTLPSSAADPASVDGRRPARRAPARPAPVTIAADSFRYDGPGRLATYTDHVVVTSNDMKITCQLLQAEFSGENKMTLRKIQARTGVDVRLPGREAKGEDAVYDLATGQITLTGGPPSIFDAELGFLTGRSLTFSPSSDTIRVESEQGSRTFTTYRLRPPRRQGSH